MYIATIEWYLLLLSVFIYLSKSYDLLKVIKLSTSTFPHSNSVCLFLCLRQDLDMCPCWPFCLSLLPARIIAKYAQLYPILVKSLKYY